MTDPRNQTQREWLAEYEAATDRPHPSRAKPGGFRSRPATSPPKKPRAKPDTPRIVAPDDTPVLIPEGPYKARCCAINFKEYWGDSKLTVTFEIVGGRYAGTRLESYFNLDRKSRAGGEQILVPKKRGAYLRLMRKLFKEQSSSDWLDPENLLNQTFQVQVQTVTRNHDKQELGCNQYSKIKPDFDWLEEE